MNSSQPSAPTLCPVFFFIVTALIKVKSETKNSTLQWLTWYCTSGVFIIIQPVGVSFATRHAAGASSSPSRTPPTHCTNLPRVFHQMVEELGDLLFHMLENVENCAGTHPWRKDGMFHLSMVYLVVQNPGNCEQKILTWGLNRIPKISSQIFDLSQQPSDFRSP